MKIKILITGILGLVSVAALAQKSELNNAKDKYDTYNVGRANKLTLAQSKKDIADAKTSIDKASENAKTSALPLTWALKGAIYSSLAVDDTVETTSMPNFKIADEALRKAKSLDSAKQDKDNQKLIESGFSNLAQIQFNKGRADFQNQKYDASYREFEYFHQIRPNDTLALYVTGLSATMAGNTDPKYYAIAIKNYNQLLGTQYSQKEAIYNDLATIYLTTKDTTKALKTIAEGVAKYPDNNNMRNREIVIGLQSGKQNELLTKIDSAIVKDPKNKSLYYYSGITYTQIAQTLYEQVMKAKVPATKASLRQKELDNYNKAVGMYKKALDIDPEYFDANLNIGLVELNLGADKFNEANQIPTNKQKEYEAAVAAANAQLDIAKPYLLKAVDLNPKSVDALSYLKKYYLGKRDMPNANATQKKIEALGGAK